jgi:hypothetical protein
VSVLLSVKFGDTLRAPKIKAAIVTLEARVRERHPEVMGIVVKPQFEETFRETRNALTGEPPKRFPAEMASPAGIPGA